MTNMAATVARKTASLPCRTASSIARKKVLSPISVMNTARKLAGKPSSALGEEASVPSAVVEASRSQAMSPSCGLCTPRLGSMAPRAAAKRRVECGRMRRVKVKHPFPRFPEAEARSDFGASERPACRKGKVYYLKKRCPRICSDYLPTGMIMRFAQSTTNVSEVRETILLAATRVATSTARARSVHATHHVGGC